MIQTDASMYKVKYVVMVAFLTIGVRMTYSIKSLGTNGQALGTKATYFSYIKINSMFLSNDHE